MMRYVLDTNNLIRANKYDFPLGQQSDFWNLLVRLGENGKILIPEVVYDEIGQGDGLLDWLKTHKPLFHKPTLDATYFLPKVMATYTNSSQIDDVLLERLKADPYVIAHALAVGGVVVTEEVSSRATAPHNKKIPNICGILNIRCITFPRFIWETRLSGLSITA